MISTMHPKSHPVLEPTRLSSRLSLSADPSQILVPGIVRPPNSRMLRLHSRVTYLIVPCVPPHQSSRQSRALALIQKARFRKQCNFKDTSPDWSLEANKRKDRRIWQDELHAGWCQ